jgi:hypothetical protein
MKTAIRPRQWQDPLPSTKPDGVEEAYVALAVATVGNGLPEALATPLRRSVRQQLEERVPLSGEHMLNIILTAKREVAGGRMPPELYQHHEDLIVAACKSSGQ